MVAGADPMVVAELVSERVEPQQQVSNAVPGAKWGRLVWMRSNSGCGRGSNSWQRAGFDFLGVMILTCSGALMVLRRGLMVMMSSSKLRGSYIE